MLGAMEGDARYLNFGAGTPAAGWVNLDSSPWFALPRVVHWVLAATGLSGRSRAFCAHAYAYFRWLPGRALPFEDGTLAAVYCSHVLEHLPASHVGALLAEFERVLAPGGRLRMLVPDLEAGLRDLLAEVGPFAPLDVALGTLPVVLGGEGGSVGVLARVRAGLEGLCGFPSCHRTVYFRSGFRAFLEQRWSVATGLGYLESRIEPGRLGAVEESGRCEGALVWELEKQ